MLKIFEYLAIGSAVAFAICLLALMFFYGSPSAAPQPPQQQHAEENKPVRNPSEAEKPFWEKATTDPVAAFTLFLVIFTAILSAVGVIQLKMLTRAETLAEKTAQAAKESADVARDTLVATNRPWIQIKSIAITSPLGFGREYGNDVGGGVNLALLVKNVGKSPAIRVGAEVQLAWTFDELASQREFCEIIKRVRDPALQTRTLLPENTLFPDDEMTFHIRAWTNREQIERALNWAGNIPDNKVNLKLIGCVYYEFSFAPGLHQTGIIFELKKKALYPDSTPPASYSAVPVEMYEPNMKTYNPDRVSDGVRLEGVIPADDLVLSRSIVGTGTID
jgi:hypothetical protein